MGQGVHTVALQVAAQELGIDPNRIDVIVDTTRQLGFGQTTGSRGTLMTAGSVQAACAAALAAGCRPGVDYEGEYVVDWTQKLGDPDDPNPTIHSCFSFAAQMVIIDRETGDIDKVVAVHDVGKAVNPMLVEGQIEGSVHMGLGYALSEDFPTDPETGFPTNMTLRSLGILRAKDVPAIEVQIVEVPQPRSPYGIKGVGEIGLVPTAPAVAAALHDLDGDWRNTLPMRRRPREPPTRSDVCVLSGCSGAPTLARKRSDARGRVGGRLRRVGRRGRRGGMRGPGPKAADEVAGVVQRGTSPGRGSRSRCTRRVAPSSLEQAIRSSRSAATSPPTGAPSPCASACGGRGATSSASRISARGSPTRWATRMKPTRRSTSARYRRWPAGCARCG